MSKDRSQRSDKNYVTFKIKTANRHLNRFVLNLVHNIQHIDRLRNAPSVALNLQIGLYLSIRDVVRKKTRTPGFFGIENPEFRDFYIEYREISEFKIGEGSIHNVLRASTVKK